LQVLYSVLSIQGCKVDKQHKQRNDGLGTLGAAAIDGETPKEERSMTEACSCNVMQLVPGYNTGTDVARYYTDVLRCIAVAPVKKKKQRIQICHSTVAVKLYNNIRFSLPRAEERSRNLAVDWSDVKE